MFCPNTGTKYHEPYHLNQVIPRLKMGVDVLGVDVLGVDVMALPPVSRHYYGRQLTMGASSCGIHMLFS